jgi:hypothetical protein
MIYSTWGLDKISTPVKFIERVRKAWLIHKGKDGKVLPPCALMAIIQYLYRNIVK